MRSPWPTLRIADLVDGNDVGVFQACHNLGFILKPFAFLRPSMRAGKDEFDRHQAIQANLPGLVDYSHAA